MKRKINIKNYLFLFAFSILLFGCNSLKNDIEQNLIRKAVFSKEFQENFNICIKDNEIFVFNDSKKNVELVFSEKNNCSKTINFLKINFKYDINLIFQKYKGIVFLGIEKNKNWYQLHFFDLETNLNLKLKYNKEQKLIDMNIGNF